jgi:S1-C subfamily serine protease
MNVDRRSNAGRLGLRRGDIVIGVNNQEISTVKQLAVVLEVPAGDWRLSIERGGKVFNLAIQG